MVGSEDDPTTNSTRIATIRRENDTSKTAAQMVVEAKAQIENISPQEASRESAASGGVVVRRSGARAALAAVTLQILGYTNVANLDGGLAAWQSAGLPVAEHHEGL